MALKDCKLIHLKTITDSRGHLTCIEGVSHIPFDIKRVYYLYDIPSNVTRGGHGHRALSQLMIAVSGEFDVVLDDGDKRQTYHLNSPSVGLYIPPMTWRDLENFTHNAVCLVLASDYYDESDYFRSYKDFIEFIKDKK